MKTEHLVSDSKLGYFYTSTGSYRPGSGRLRIVRASDRLIIIHVFILMTEQTSPCWCLREDGQLQRRCLVEGHRGVRPHNNLAGCFDTIKTQDYVTGACLKAYIKCDEGTGECY